MSNLNGYDGSIRGSGSLPKVNRRFQLIIQPTDRTSLLPGNQIFNPVIIETPFTLELMIQRDLYSSVNVATLRVMNLNKNTRSKIRKDQQDYGNLKQVILKAGYNDNLFTCLSGTISIANSNRESDTWVTQIEAYDGGGAWQNANISQQFQAAGGTTLKSVATNLIDSLSEFGLQRGAIGDLGGLTLTRGNSYAGPTLSVLGDLSKGGLFIDNGVVNILGPNECLQTSIPVINSRSGLLGTPVLENQRILFDMLFAPEIKLGQLVNLQVINSDNSSQQVAINGLHKVVGIRHRGTISGSVCGDAVTSLTLQPGDFIPVLGGK